MNDDPASLPYRMGVGIMLADAQGRIFIAKRIDMISEAWQMPQGGIDPGETPTEAARRELKEEIGTDKARILHESEAWYDYDLPSELIARIWGGKYRGQRQKWFLMRFLGKDSDINLDTEEPEFTQWKWVEPRELPNLIVPFKQDLYRRLVDDFSPLLKSKNDSN